MGIHRGGTAASTSASARHSTQIDRNKLNITHLNGDIINNTISTAATTSCVNNTNQLGDQTGSPAGVGIDSGTSPVAYGGTNAAGVLPNSIIFN